jgi:hypothetical protein
MNPSDADLAEILQRPGYRISPQGRSVRSGKETATQARSEGESPARARKYRNEPIILDGQRFDSKKEGQRWGDLQLLERSGQIRSLTRQRKFDLSVQGVKICSYTCDFEYFELKDGCWAWIVEDVKSDATRKLPVFRIKKKLMKAIWKVEIRET